MTARLTDDELTVLARLLPPGPRANKVLEQAGFDEEHRPVATAGMASIDYWELIDAEIGKGVIADGRRRIIAAALKRYPFNDLLLAAGLPATWRVLFIGASPDGMDPLRTGRELDLLRKADRRIEVEYIAAGRVTDLNEIRRQRPDVLHLACHGRGDKLYFETDDRVGKTVYVAQIAETLRVYGVELGLRLRGIVLNACHSETAASILSGHADTVIAHRGELVDDDAIAFTAALYAALPSVPTLGSAARIAVRELVRDDETRQPLEAGLVIHEPQDRP